MKHLLLFVLIAAATCISCNRDATGPTSNSLDGLWRMIAVKDKSTGTITTKPATIQGEVELFFQSTNASNGMFAGKTPSNDIFPSSYSLGAGQQISIPVLDMTKVNETAWGNEFVSHIRSAQTFAFDAGGLLYINADTRLLTFKKQ
jgi:hypothetical protein